MENAKSQKRGTKKAKRKKPAASDRCLYRVLGYQPLSVEMETQTQTLEGISIQNTLCKICIRSTQTESTLQFQSGGSILAIEFEAESKQDLIVAARNGLSLLEDFLSAIALVNGSPFQTTEPIQVARLGGAKVDGCEFLVFKPIPLRHWVKPITRHTVATAKNLLAHWDGLESGHRLRRAALHYRQAIGNLDDTAAFQESYIGLESMEPPLAKAAGLTPGTEEKQGSCDACGHEYTIKKTTLVGVRTFVLDSLDPKSAEESRKADWKLINRLRNHLMHGLVDPEKVSDRTHKAMLAAMHHLHASICLASHSEELVTNQYRIARGGRIYLLIGNYKATSWPELHKWETAIEIEDVTWVPHEQGGSIPQMSIKNEGLEDLEIGIAFLDDPFSLATMDSIKSSRYEHV